jgi:hypothetical protein
MTDVETKYDRLFGGSVIEKRSSLFVVCRSCWSAFAADCVNGGAWCARYNVVESEELATHSCGACDTSVLRCVAGFLRCWSLLLVGMRARVSFRLQYKERVKGLGEVAGVQFCR